MDTARLQLLFDRYMQQTATDAEEAELMQLLADPAHEAAIKTLAGDAWTQWPSDNLLSGEQSEHLYDSIQEAIAAPAGRQSKKIAMRYWWPAAAAILVILLGAVLFLWRKPATQKDTVAVPAVKSTGYDVGPGSNKASLTMANGKVITLDSTANRALAQQDNIHIDQQGHRLVYDAPATTGPPPAWNILSTPRGGQYQLVLPDGSHVWLNAASSIRYPIAFTGPERRVQITGEAYFEVAHQAGRPFIISRGDAEVQVLGTHFNVNAYDDEDNIKVTLVEGSVQVSQLAAHTSRLLAPGQQLLVEHSGALQLVKNADINKALAWKNGLFNFQDASLKEVMRQLSRWYDIEVVYEKGVPNTEFVGKMDRNVTLAGLLKGLEGFGVHFRLEAGRRLVVMP